MATEGVNITEDAEMAECEGDKVVTMMDVLQEQQEFEEDANAVLGASDDKNCTYSKGYIKRQAIYACLTCCPDVKTDPTKRAGVCLACSLMCHENHELVELYTKRNFRCDCGNPKFNSHPCQFTPSKPDLNEENIYNQNFSGLYCICHRPYPDPDATTEDDMIQCIICEDWLHASHLDATVPSNDLYSEMICKGCMEKNEFLHDYGNYAMNVDAVEIDFLKQNVHKTSDSLCNGDVTVDVLTNGDIETKPEPVAEKSNFNEKSEHKTMEEKEKDQELNAGNNENTESKSNDNANLNAESQGAQEPESEVNQKSKDDEGKVPTESENKDVEMSKDEQNTNSDDNKEGENVETNLTSSEAAAKIQEQKDEQPTTVVKDNEHKDDTNKNEDNNTDSNKTEAQLLDDIRALTSDSPPSDDTSKPSIEVTTNEPQLSENATKESQPAENVTKESQPSENATKESNDEEKQVDGSEKQEKTNNEENIEKMEEASTEKPADNSASASTNPTSENSDIEVSDTSQVKDTEMANSDAKTDSVMDAIDELLQDPVETNKRDSEENESSEELEASKANADNSNETETSTKTDTHEKTDVEMAEVKDHNAPNDDKAAMDANDDKAAMDANDSTSEAKPADADSDNKSELNEPVKETTSDKMNESETDNQSTAETDNTNKNETLPNKNRTSDESEKTNEYKRKLSIEAEETSPKKIKLGDKCVRPKGVIKVYKGATFWPSNFRQKLCTCGECISMYKDLHVLFLTDPEDTVSFYESLGKENVDGGASQYEKGLQALSSLDRIQQINALTEYNKMRDKLLDFLKSFKDRKEVVKEEDIKAFFAGMKPKREPDGVYFCR